MLDLRRPIEIISQILKLFCVHVLTSAANCSRLQNREEAGGCCQIPQLMLSPHDVRDGGCNASEVTRCTENKKLRKSF